MKQAAKEAFENNMHHHDTMKRIAKAYLSNREYSVQEGLYHIFQNWIWGELFKLCILLTQIFEKKEFWLLLSEGELNKRTDDSSNIFKKANIDRYLEDQVQHSTMENTVF